MCEYISIYIYIYIYNRENERHRGRVGGGGGGESGKRKKYMLLKQNYVSSGQKVRLGEGETGEKIMDKWIDRE